MARSSYALIAVVLYSALAAVIVWLLPPGGPRSGVLLAPLILICPGYALTRALEGRHRISGLECAVLSLTLSFVTCALGGLALHVLGIALTARNWSALIVVVTATAAVAAVVRWHPAAGTARHAFSRPSPGTALVGLAVCGLLAGAAVIATSSQARLDERQSVTQLAALPLPHGNAIRISLRNADRKTEHYEIRIVTPARTQRIPVALTPGGRWSDVRRIRRRPGQEVAIQLFRAGRHGGSLRSVILR